MTWQDPKDERTGMTFQDSDSDLAGKLGASLTPPAPRTRHVHLPRGEQSSGFFDLDALYTMYPEQARPAPLPVMVPKRARSMPILIEEEPAIVLRRTARPKPIGWFAILVTWLATTTLGGLAATQIPGHVHLRTQAGTVAPVTIAPATTVTTVPAAPASVAIPPAAPSSSDNAISVDQLPVAAAALAHAHPLGPPHVRHVAPHPARPANPPPAPVNEAEAAPSTAPPPPPVAKAAPVSTANTSLDELIRHEVAAEQKRVHPTAPAP
jgi:hypothetical protein